MFWLLLALSTAFFEAVKDVFSKSGLRNIDEYVLTWCLSVFTVLFLFPVLLVIGIPSLQPNFWIALVVGGSLNTIAFLLYVKAIKQSDLSITLPIVNFTPLFLLLTSPLIVHESLTLLDFCGSLLIIAGSYVLNLKNRRDGYLAPFRSLICEPGPKLMLVVALIWSFTSAVDKVGVQNSSPLFWAISLYSFVGLALPPIMVYKSPSYFRHITRNLKALLPIGFFNAIAIFCQMNALTMTLVVNVISVKRTSTLIGALFGFLVFQERGIRQRLLGAVIMVLGVILIAQR